MKTHLSKNDFSQTVLISVLLAIEVAGFIAIPFLSVAGYCQFYLSMLLNLLLVVNNMATPIVILSFNVDVRHQLKIALHHAR